MNLPAHYRPLNFTQLSKAVGIPLDRDGSLIEEINQREIPIAHAVLPS